MSISVSNSVMNYARSLQGTPIKKYSALSPMVLRSKAGKSNTVTNSSVKRNKGENGNIEKAQNNSGTISTDTEKKVFKTNSEIFYNNYFNTNGDTSFEIDGIAFSAEEIDAVRSVVQNAVSPLLGL